MAWAAQGVRELAVELGGWIPQGRLGGEVFGLSAVAGDAGIAAGPTLAAEIVFGTLQPHNTLWISRSAILGNECERKW